MTVGRFLSDKLSQKLGAIRTLGYGCMLAILGYGLILNINIYSSVVGFTCLGFGLSPVVQIFRLAGKNKILSSSVAISIVSGIGFIGFMIGPVLLGLIANSASLVYSYVALLTSIIVTFGIVILFLKNEY